MFVSKVISTPNSIPRKRKDEINQDENYAKLTVVKSRLAKKFTQSKKLC